MNILVVGAGEMGTWFGSCLSFSVAYADHDRDTAARAAETTDGRDVPLSTEEHFDAVCLAVPMSAISEAIALHAARAERAIIDITGVMGIPIEGMREHAPDLERLSLHPLFSTDHAPGRVAYVPDSPGPVTESVTDDLAGQGNTLFETTPEEHDRAMSTVQARTHAAVLAFGLAREEVREEFQTPISEQLAQLTEQVTNGNPRVYAEIQETFDGATDVADAAGQIAEADEAAFEALYRDAR